jgi:hypothetical protein
MITVLVMMLVSKVLVAIVSGTSRHYTGKYTGIHRPEQVVTTNSRSSGDSGTGVGGVNRGGNRKGGVERERWR